MQRKKTINDLKEEIQVKINELKAQSVPQKLINYFIALQTSNIPQIFIQHRAEEVYAIEKILRDGVLKSKNKAYYEEKLAYLNQLTSTLSAWESELQQSQMHALIQTTTASPQDKGPAKTIIPPQQEEEPMLANSEAWHHQYNQFTNEYGIPDPETNQKFRDNFQFKSNESEDERLLRELQQSVFTNFNYLIAEGARRYLDFFQNFLTNASTNDQHMDNELRKFVDVLISQFEEGIKPNGDLEYYQKMNQVLFSVRETVNTAKAILDQYFLPTVQAPVEQTIRKSPTSSSDMWAKNSTQGSDPLQKGEAATKNQNPSPTKKRSP